MRLKYGFLFCGKQRKFLFTLETKKYLFYKMQEPTIQQLYTALKEHDSKPISYRMVYWRRFCPKTLLDLVKNENVSQIIVVEFNKTKDSSKAMVRTK